MSLLADVMLSSFSMMQWAILIIVACGIIGIVIVITRQMGVQIPPFIIQVLWILLAVVIGIAAIKFIAGMW